MNPDNKPNQPQPQNQPHNQQQNQQNRPQNQPQPQNQNQHVNKPFNQTNQQNNQPFSPKPQSSLPNKGNEMIFDKYVAIALIVGIIAGFIIGNSVGSSKSKVGKNASSTASDLIDNKNASSTNNDDTAMIGTSLNDSIGKISVEDQKAGNTVTIKKLEIGESYWVAVRDSQSSTKVPYILGAKKVTAGSYDDFSIYVSRATENGKKYDVVLYKDNPSFNYDSSMLVMNDDDIAGATFTAN